MSHPRRAPRRNDEPGQPEHVTVVPLCPFVANYIKRHAEYSDLVPAEYQSRIS